LVLQTKSHKTRYYLQIEHAGRSVLRRKRQRSGKNKTNCEQTGKPKYKTLKFAPSKIIGKPKGCLRYAASGASEF